MAKTNPFLEIQSLSSDLWHERKGLDWTRNIRERKVIAKRMKKLFDQIHELDFKEEFEMLDKFYFDGEKILSE